MPADFACSRASHVRQRDAVVNDFTSMVRAVRDEIRTLWINRDPELVDVIESIRELEIKLRVNSPDRGRGKIIRRDTPAGLRHNHQRELQRFLIDPVREGGFRS